MAVFIFVAIFISSAIISTNIDCYENSLNKLPKEFRDNIRYKD